MMPFRRALLSASTLFGGHFLNRRLDRVVLIAALLAVAAMVSIALPLEFLLLREPQLNWLIWALRLPLTLVGAIALLSAGLTFRDARQPSGGPLTTTIRVARLPLSLFGVLVVAVAFVIASLSYTRVIETPRESVVPTAGRLYFGTSADVDLFEFLPAPPGGPERLHGRIMLNGTGIDSADLSLTLNNEYKVEHVHSDSRGVFEIPLPAGKWHINDIVVRDWAGRPKDRDLILFSNHEPMKDEGPYSRLNYLLADGGLPVSLPASSNTTPVEIEFRDPLAMTWPSGNVPDAEFSTAAIAWQPVRGASEYEVQIGHIVRDGTITYPSHILTRRISGLSLPLASLPQRSASALADEYSVHVFAFDGQGHLLTESNLESADRKFKLTGARRLGREQQNVGSRGDPEVISAEYENNDLRLELAEKLLHQKRFDDARLVLDQVTKDAPLGRASALRGRLAALQGDCVTAIRLFDKAESEGGCVDEERKLCEAPKK